MAQPQNDIPVVPSEIRDLFFDELRDHKASLASCALVCRAWTSPTRRHLFHTISIAEESQWNLTAFLKFLGELEEVHIRICTLDVMAWSSKNLMSGESSVPLDLHVLAAVLSSLPHLRKLRLIQLTFTNGCQPSPPQTAFTLEELIVQQTHKERECTFKTLGVLSLFTEVRRLCLQDSSRLLGPQNDHTRELRVDGELSRSRKPQVYSLTFRSIYDMVYYWRTLIRSSSSQTLGSVGATCLAWDEIEAFRDLLDEVGHCVLSVELDVLVSARKNETYPSFDLSDCTSVRSLVLGLNLTPSDNYAWTVVAEALRHTTNTPLRDITFRVTVLYLFSELNFLAVLKRLDTVVMDQALNIFENLETVTFEFSWYSMQMAHEFHSSSRPADGPSLFLACRDALERMLPTTFARGLLRIR